MLQFCRRAITAANFNFNLSTQNFLQKCENGQRKKLWGYVAIAFNKVDEERLKKVGPDRLCAEWLLKNGGKVCFVELPNHLIKDYNSLPPENTKVHVKIVDATKSSVMKIGLEHFVNCKHIEKVIFHECMHLEEDGLDGLRHLKDSLKTLQVSHCYNLTDAGLRVIGDLSNLKELKIYDFRYVKDLDEVIRYLQKQLPNCKISSQPTDC